MRTNLEEQTSNRADDRPFDEVAAARYSRRSVLGGGIATAALAFLGGPGGPLLADRAGSSTRGAQGSGLLGFQSVSASSTDALTVPPGYVADVLIPWGTPLSSSGPAWKKDGSNTTAEQTQQVGFNHDGLHFFPLGRDRGLLAVNHEYTDASQLYPDDGTPLSPDKVAKALAAHGASVVAVALVGGVWQQVDSGYNRRITGNTPMAFSGPVGGRHPELRANNPPVGMLNNCGAGHTPWGTYLTCEENFNGYFGTADPAWLPSAVEARYGISAADFGYGWHTVDPRFDVAVNPKELNRFGWVVEVDPFKPGAKPVKRTALGRFKHESAAVTESAGRVVVYSGDDETGNYVYKFVGSESWQLLRSLGKSPLDHGRLFVARFNDDGSGDWLPLEFGSGPLTRANGWVDQADVLIRTRLAADAVGATKMDRPEWITIHPATGEVYASCTNGSTGPTPPNPRNPNPYGHIIRWSGEHLDATFSWDLFVLCGDPFYDPLSNINGDIYGSPDGLWIDPDGRLWIQTDVSNSSQLLADRGYDHIGNNQMLAADPDTGETRRFLVGPRGCEITGVMTTPDQTAMFISVQHPGESTTAIGTPTPADPRVVSNWPDFDPAGRPRPSTVVIRKEDGGKIGT